MVELQRTWVDKERREALMRILEERMVYVDILREILHRPDVDSFDLIAHVGFDSDLHSREERVTALLNLHREFFQSYDEPAREVLQTLIEKYRYGGLSEVTDPAIFRLAPFNSNVRKVAESFGGIDTLRQSIDELVRRIYQVEAA